MAKHGKRYREAAAKVDRNHRYPFTEAMELALQTASSKFDETVDVAVALGVNPRHADQMVRGAVVLPHGLGKTVRVLVFAKGEKVKEAEEALKVERKKFEDERAAHQEELTFAQKVRRSTLMGEIAGEYKDGDPGELWYDLSQNLQSFAA